MRYVVMVTAALLLFGAAYPAAADGPWISALTLEATGISPWIRQQNAWFAPQPRDRYWRTLGFGTCETTGGKCEWFAHANGSGYVQLNLSSKLSPEELTRIKRIKFPEASPENWRASAETRAMGGGIMSWIGTSDTWVLLHCTGEDFRCDNRAIIGAILEKLNGTGIRFSVQAYYP